MRIIRPGKKESPPPEAARGYGRRSRNETAATEDYCVEETVVSAGTRSSSGSHPVPAVSRSAREASSAFLRWFHAGTSALLTSVKRRVMPAFGEAWPAVPASDWAGF